MVNFLLKEEDRTKYFNISEEQVLSNREIKVYPVEGKIDIYNDIARVMANKLKENNQLGNITSFILPVGPRGQYERFARICNLEKISCKNLITINMDEYLDGSGNLIPESHPLSFRGFMRKNLFELLENTLRIKPENIYFPDPDNTSEIGNLMHEIRGVDICFIGIGINGHIAFNEPMDEKEITVGEFRELKTRVLDIAKETAIINSIKYGGYTEFIPKTCITIGMAEIFKARELRIYLEHNWQSAVLRKMIFADITPSFPATYLKRHENSSITASTNVLKKYE